MTNHRIEDKDWYALTAHKIMPQISTRFMYSICKEWMLNLNQNCLLALKQDLRDSFVIRRIYPMILHSCFLSMLNDNVWHWNEKFSIKSQKLHKVNNIININISAAQPASRSTGLYKIPKGWRSRENLPRFCEPSSPPLGKEQFARQQTAADVLSRVTVLQ